MNKPFYIFPLLILFCCEAKTQTNLVYNGDFEIYSSCPNTISSSGSIEMTKCIGWINPTEATPDYFNVCNNSLTGIVGIPYNSVGFQYSKNGTGYMGIIPFEYDGITFWYEYIQGEIITSLTKDKWYNISFYVSLADGYADIALRHIGAYLSLNSFTLTGTNRINVTPQIKKNNYITDTLDWVKIDGKFKASGGESFITIGYFDDITNDSIRVNNLPPSGVSSYYYIDDVNLSETECLEIIPNVFTPNKDGINDVLIITTCDEIKKITIYNRWGNQVFETTDINYFWDGRTTSGEDCVDGTYYYIIKTKEENIKGFVQLAR